MNSLTTLVLCIFCVSFVSADNFDVDHASVAARILANQVAIEAKLSEVSYLYDVYVGDKNRTDAVEVTIPGLERNQKSLEISTSTSLRHWIEDKAHLEVITQKVVDDTGEFGKAEAEFKDAKANWEASAAILESAVADLDAYLDAVQATVDFAKKAATDSIEAISCDANDQFIRCDSDTGGDLLWWANRLCPRGQPFICSSREGGHCQCPISVAGPVKPPISDKDAALVAISQERAIVEAIELTLSDLRAAKRAANFTYTEDLEKLTQTEANYKEKHRILLKDTEEKKDTAIKAAEDEYIYLDFKLRLSGAEVELSSALRLLDELQALTHRARERHDEVKSRTVLSVNETIRGSVNIVQSLFGCRGDKDCEDTNPTNPPGPFSYFATRGCTGNPPNFVCNHEKQRECVCPSSADSEVQFVGIAPKPWK